MSLCVIAKWARSQLLLGTRVALPTRAPPCEMDTLRLNCPPVLVPRWPPPGLWSSVEPVIFRHVAPPRLSKLFTAVLIILTRGRQNDAMSQPTTAESRDLGFVFLITETCQGRMANSCSHVFINLHCRNQVTKLNLISEIKNKSCNILHGFNYCNSSNIIFM